MPGKNEPDVTLSESQSPETEEIPDTPMSAARKPKLVIRRLKTNVLEPRGIPFSLVILIGLAYILIAALIAVLLTPLNMFGLFSLTAGAALAIIIYHPEGLLKPDTRKDEIVYYGSVAAFVIVGLRYLLAGILLSNPLP